MSAQVQKLERPLSPDELRMNWLDHPKHFIAKFGNCWCAWDHENGTECHGNATAREAIDKIRDMAPRKKEEKQPK